jgi:hypothetical protein
MASAVVSAAVARVLDRLQGVRRTRLGGLGVCPSHADHRPSLDVAEGADGRALVYCHAGCRTSEVLVALGLRWADLFPPRSAAARWEPGPRTLNEADHARRDVLAEARRQQARRERYAELTAEADSIRLCDRVIREARAVATRLGPRDDVLELLRRVAELDTMTRAAEARLDAEMSAPKAG